MDSKRQETEKTTDRQLPAECKTLAVRKAWPVSPEKDAVPNVHSLHGLCIRALGSKEGVNMSPIPKI